MTHQLCYCSKADCACHGKSYLDSMRSRLNVAAKEAEKERKGNA